MTESQLSAAEVLKRYVDEDLPEFSAVELSDVNQVGNFGNRPLHVASVRGDLREVRALLDAGADIDAAGELGNTALHEAIGQAHVDVVRVLIDRGANPDLENEFGDTAAAIAALKQRDDLLDALQRRQ